MDRKSDSVTEPRAARSRTSSCQRLCLQIVPEQVIGKAQRLLIDQRKGAGGPKVIPRGERPLTAFGELKVQASAEEVNRRRICRRHERMLQDLSVTEEEFQL